MPTTGAATALGSFIDAIATEGPNGHHPLVTGRRIGVIATAGDRRDRDIRELGSGGGLLRPDRDPRGPEPRGRQRGATADLLREGVEAAVRDGARCRKIEIVLDELDATRHALDQAERATSWSLRGPPTWPGVQHRLHGTVMDVPAATLATNGAGSSADIDAEDFFTDRRGLSAARGDQGPEPREGDRSIALLSPTRRRSARARRGP